MDSDDEIEGLEEQFAELLNRRDPVSDLAVQTAKDLFGIHQLDDILAELSAPIETGSRAGDASTGPADEPMHFAADGVTMTVSLQVGRVHITVVPPVGKVSLESEAGSARLVLDASGGASVAAEGAVRLRVSRPNTADVVTESFLVQRPPR